MSKDIELKPCPFCGGEADFDAHLASKYEVEELGFADSYYAECEGCEISTTPQDSYIKAANTWNTRAPIKGEG